MKIVAGFAVGLYMPPKVKLAFEAYSKSFWNGMNVKTFSSAYII
jgi:hypothetical protein